MAAFPGLVSWLLRLHVMVSRDSGVILGKSKGLGLMLSYANIPERYGSHTNKHADIPEAAVRKQTRDSWQCLRGPRPELGLADRRQMHLCLKDTRTAVSKDTHSHTAMNSQARKALLTVYFQLAS